MIVKFTILLFFSFFFLQKNPFCFVFLMTELVVNLITQLVEKVKNNGADVAQDETEVDLHRSCTKAVLLIHSSFYVDFRGQNQ